MSNYVKIECPKGSEELAATWQLKPLYVKSDQQVMFNALFSQLKNNPLLKLKDLVGCSEPRECQFSYPRLYRFRFSGKLSAIIEQYSKKPLKKI